MHGAIYAFNAYWKFKYSTKTRNGSIYNMMEFNYWYLDDKQSYMRTLHSSMSCMLQLCICGNKTNNKIVDKTILRVKLIENE